MASILVSSVKAQVFSRVKAGPGCEKPAEVFVSQGKALLFQIHVPLNGNFEIKLNPGKYEFVAITEDGCEGHRALHFQKKEVRTELKIAKNRREGHKRKPSFAGSDMAASGQSPVMLGRGPHFSSMYPWWYPWSMYMFPASSQYPCVWAVWGCNSRYYPQGGPIVMGKPNIYVEGPDVENAKIELKRVEHHKLMATAPAHMEKGWTFSLTNNKINVEGVQYPYLFYDSRAELNHIPNQTDAFCGDRDEVLAQMNEVLEKMKFPKTARADFSEHWLAKLPRFKEFCIYPQVNEELNKASPLKISLSSYSLSRVLFLIIPKPARRDQPKEAFLREFVKRTPAEWVAPEAKTNKAKWKVYEWGVAFPFEAGTQ